MRGGGHAQAGLIPCASSHFSVRADRYSQPPSTAAAGIVASCIYEHYYRSGVVNEQRTS